MLEFLFSFPSNFFLGLFAFIFLCLAVERLMRENPDPNYTYHNMSKFFTDSLDLISIIGVIATLISLAPLFLTFFLGEDWFHLLLITQIGIIALGLLIIATISASLFIIFLVALILARWVTQIFLNIQIRISEKIISFTILLSGAIAIFSLGYFLVISWFSRINAPITLTGITIFTFYLSLFFLISIAIFIELTSFYPYIARIISYILIILFFFFIVGNVVYPTIDNGYTIYKIASNYSANEQYNLTFNLSPITKNNESITTFLITPNFTEFEKRDSINKEYYDCHWSTNYGHFITIDSKTLLIQKRSSEFIIPTCVQNPKLVVYWTYDSLDYFKQKPPLIISLQVENSNKRLAFEKLDNSIEYVVGSYYSNFTWNGYDNNNLSLNNTAIV